MAPFDRLPSCSVRCSLTFTSPSQVDFQDVNARTPAERKREEEKQRRLDRLYRQRSEQAVREMQGEGPGGRTAGQGALPAPGAAPGRRPPAPAPWGLGGPGGADTRAPGPPPSELRPPRFLASLALAAPPPPQHVLPGSRAVRGGEWPRHAEAQSGGTGPRWGSPGGGRCGCTGAGGRGVRPPGPRWSCPPRVLPMAAGPEWCSQRHRGGPGATACGWASPAAAVARLSLRQPPSLC